MMQRSNVQTRCALAAILVALMAAIIIATPAEQAGASGAASIRLVPLTQFQSQQMLHHGGQPVIQIQERGLFRLFRNNRRQRPLRRFRFDPSFRRNAPAVRRDGAQRPANSAPRRATTRTAPAIQQLDKNPDARRILVLGDFFAQSLAKGLADAFAQDRTVAIDLVANGSSGFVRYDFFNWERELAKALTNPQLGGRADLVLIMMGGNDRQFFRVPRRISLDTQDWTTQYEANVDNFAGQIVSANIPLIWVGMPPVRGPKTSGQMAKISGIFRDEAQEIGARYVDIWDAFADSSGKYSDFGPDVNGQRAQLRTSNGFGFSAKGREKLTFFVKRQVDRYLTGAGDVIGTPGGLIPTEDGPVLSLNGYALEDGLALKGGPDVYGPPMAPPEPWEHVATATYNTLVRGIIQPAPPQRADHFQWSETSSR